MSFLLEPHILIWILIASVIAISIFVELEEGSWATTIFSISIALLLWKYWGEVFGWISQNPLSTLLFIAFYTISGIIWAIIKWKSYISRHARKILAVKEEFVRVNGDISKNWVLWVKYLNNEFRGVYLQESDEPEDVYKKMAISASDKSGVIISWITYWPMSIASTLLNDPVRRFMTWIYERVSGLFQRMSENSTKSVMDGITKETIDAQKKSEDGPGRKNSK